jgi:hypothetical protein
VCHGSTERLDRRDPPQALLDRGGDARVVAGQRVSLVRMSRQRERASRDEVPGRLVPRDEQREAVADGLGRTHAPTVDLGRRKRRDDVVTVALAAGIMTVPARTDAIDKEPVQRREIVERRRLGIGRGDRGIGPTAEVVAVGVADAEQLRDDEHRERRRDPIHEIDRLAGRDLVEHRARRGAHRVGERRRGAEREAPAHELPPGCRADPCGGSNRGSLRRCAADRS